MIPKDSHDEARLLASTMALVGAYNGIRASLELPKLQTLLGEMDSYETAQPWSLGHLFLSHPYWIIAAVIITFIATFVAIWSKIRGRKFIYCGGILLLFILTDRALASVLDPIVRMISMMSNQ